MIELQKADIEKLDLILEVISEQDIFGLTWKGIEHKKPNFFKNLNPKDFKDLIFFDHNAREYERLASVFKKYDCGNVNKVTPFEGGELTISRNHNTLQFKKQGGFKRLYSELKEKKKRENIEFELAESNIRANKLNEKIAKRNKKETIINIVIGLINIGLLIWQSILIAKS